MIRCLILIFLVAAAWSRTLDGVGRADLDGPDRPHGIEGDHSRGNLGLPCKDCNELRNEDRRSPLQNEEVDRVQTSNSHETQKEGRKGDHQRNQHKRRTSSLERIVKPFISTSRVKVSVTRNGRRLPIRRLPPEHPANKRLSSDNPPIKRLLDKNIQTRHAPNENSQTRHASNENSQTKYASDENSQTRHVPNENSQTRHASNENSQTRNAPNENSRTRHMSRKNSKAHEESQRKELHISTGNDKPDNIVDVLTENKGRKERIENDNEHKEHLPEQRDRKRGKITKSKVYISTEHINSESIRNVLIDKTEDGEQRHGERNNKKAVAGKGDITTENVKPDAYIDPGLDDDIAKYTKGPIHKTNKNDHHKKGHSHRAQSDKSTDENTSTGNIRGNEKKQKRPISHFDMVTEKVNRNANTKSKLDEKDHDSVDNDRQLSEPIKLRTGDRGSSRWKSPDLPQVPDVERLERRLHPKVEAPVEDITMALRRIMHQMQHYIYTTEYNYRHTFNSTRWEIITSVREELLNIAKENDHVYDAVMEVSLHTKELYLRGHQRRQFNEAQAASSLPYTQRPSVQNLYLRSKYEYASDELKYAQSLKRKILDLQRKRSTLRYDYTVLTRKISEKLPTQALYDLGRRANQTIHILDHSRTMRDSLDRSRMYGYSHNSTFLDMRIARNHINDAYDIVVALKQQYQENHMKAKEIKRLRQTVHVGGPTDVFDMNHFEQWALVDRAKLHANDLFTTAAMALMKFKPLLRDANDVIDAAKKGTHESRFERTIRTIREHMELLNTTMAFIRGDVCTDQYEVCVPKRKELEELSTDDKLTEESSGDTDQEGDDDDVEESSGDGKVEVTTTSVPKKTTTTEAEEESNSWFNFWSNEEKTSAPEGTLTTAQSTTLSASETTPTSTEPLSSTSARTSATTTRIFTSTSTTKRATTEITSNLTEHTSSLATKTSTTTPRTVASTSPIQKTTPEITSPLPEQTLRTMPATSTTPLTTSTSTSQKEKVSSDISSSQAMTSTSRTAITSNAFATTEKTLTNLEDGKDTFLPPDTDDEDLIDELSGDGSGSGMSMEISEDEETTANTRDKNNKNTSIHIWSTDDEDFIDEIKQAQKTTNITKTATQVPAKVSRVPPTSASAIATEGSISIDDKTDKRITTLITDTDDEDIIDEMEKAKKTTKTMHTTSKPTATPVPTETTTEEEEETGSWWWNDSFGLLSDQVWGSDTRHKRETRGDATALSNITLTELILEHLRNRSGVNGELLSQAKLRLKSVSDLQNHLDRVKSQIDLYENHTLQVKSFTHTWKAEAAVARAVHNRVNDVSKDVEFKHSVFQEQNAKSIKKAEAKLQRMQDAYEANKERITDNSGPDSAKEALELAQKVKDNIGAIVSLKQLNPSPCKKFQSMDHMIRANISELRHKIKQAKLLAASLQVAVTMEGSSHLEIPLPGMGTNKLASTKVELAMKTHSGDGVVALVQTNKTGAVALSLDDFVPKITILDDGQYNMGDNSADLPLQNDTWYKFTIERFASNYNLTVYKGTSLFQSFITAADEDYPTVYNAPSSVFIGGATDKYDMDHWKGCIGPIHVNGKYLNMLTTDNKKTLPKACTVLSYKDAGGRSLILVGNGYAFYELDSRQHSSRVTSFAANFTVQSNGTVFSVNAENNRFTVTTFVKGRQLFIATRHYGMKSDLVSVSDVIGTEQRIEISSDGRSINVMLNGRKDVLTRSIDPIDVVTSQRIGIYLGASSNTSRSVRGCVHGLSLNNVDLPLNSMSDAAGITYGHCQDTSCLTFNATSVPVMLSNLTGANEIAVVFSYGSKSGLVQYKKGEKFNLNIVVGDDGLEIIEKVKDNSDTIELSDSKFNEGDDVVMMIKDEDKTLTVTVGDESSSFSYGSGGGFWFLSSDDDDDDADIPYNITIGSTENEGVILQGNIVTLRINDRHVDLTSYLMSHKLQRCISPRSEKKTRKIESPILERKQLAC